MGIQRSTWSFGWPLAAIIALTAAAWFTGGHALAQQQPRALPTFAVDRSWPKVPDQYKLGDISSVAIDAQDNAYVLHRPRTLKADNAASAAPAVVVFDPDGSFIKAWGGPGPNYEWVEREHGIHIDHSFKRTWGAFGKPPGGKDNCAIARLTEFAPGDGLPDFNVAHSIRVSNDGTVYLADRENRRVQMFSSDGKFVKQLRHTAAPFAANLAFSPDPEQQFLYVGGGKAITIVDRKTLEVLGQVQEEGQLGGGHHIATDSKGNLYIAQTTAGMQRLMFKGLSAPAVR